MLARGAEAASGHDVRVLLFTDVQPNVGATSSSELSAMVQAGTRRQRVQSAIER